MHFWMPAIVLALGCGAVIAVVLLRGRVAEAASAAYDLEVYRDQLKEVDRDLARGIIAEQEAERIRTEVSRRVLAADKALNEADASTGQPVGSGRFIAAFAVIGLVTVSVFLYTQLGAPGYDDLPRSARLAASEEARANRPDQAALEARQTSTSVEAQASEDYRALVAQLRAAVAERRDDLQGFTLLARNEAALGNLVAAHQAQARVIELKGARATAEDYVDLADLMISAAGGLVSAEAETVLRGALARAPDHPRARYYLGLYMVQIDRPDAAFRLWDTLLRESAPSDPWTPLIRDRIEDLAWRAGVIRYRLPPEGEQRGPTWDDLQSAGNLTPEERLAMARNMVDGLEDRVLNEGGDVAEWARLTNGLTVLGEFDRVRAALERARMVFADRPEDLDLIENAAKQAGFSE
ncbi:MAG: c-type cytochrome biogenesis protein CcmI [Pseudomonadota bacterium]